MTSTLTCKNNLDDSIFNRCFIEPESFWYGIAFASGDLFGEKLFATMTIFFVVGFPLFFVARYTGNKFKMHYRRKFIHLLNFLHRIAYPYIWFIACYTIFRQHRPCLCSKTPEDPNSWKQVGSIYGMPSGDSVLGGVLGTSTLLYKPFGFIPSIVVGVLIIALKPYERLILGWHSLGQVTVGTLLGCLCTIHNLHMPQYFIFIDIVIGIILQSIAFPLNSGNLHYDPGDVNDIYSWQAFGWGLMVFEAVLVFRYYKQQQFEGLRSSLFSWFKPRQAERIKEEDILDPETEIDESDFEQRLVVPGDSLPSSKYQENEMDSEQRFLFYSFFIIFAGNILCGSFVAYGLD